MGSRIGSGDSSICEFTSFICRRGEACADDGGVTSDAEDPLYVYDWRLEPERAMRAEKGTGMSDEKVREFVDGCACNIPRQATVVLIFGRLPGLRAIHRRTKGGYLRGGEGKAVTTGGRQEPTGEGGNTIIAVNPSIKLPSSGEKFGRCTFVYISRAYGSSTTCLVLPASCNSSASKPFSVNLTAPALTKA